MTASTSAYPSGTAGAEMSSEELAFWGALIPAVLAFLAESPRILRFLSEQRLVRAAAYADEDMAFCVDVENNGEKAIHIANDRDVFDFVFYRSRLHRWLRFLFGFVPKSAQMGSANWDLDKGLPAYVRPDDNEQIFGILDLAATPGAPGLRWILLRLEIGNRIILRRLRRTGNPINRPGDIEGPPPSSSGNTAAP